MLQGSELSRKFLKLKTCAMIFRRYSTMQSKKSAEELKHRFIGQHLNVHVLDFEVSLRDGDIKIIPHAEADDHVYTLPITRIRLLAAGTGSTIKMMSKPRRIDIGGPYLIMIFVCFMIIAGVLLYLLGEGKYNNTAYILCGLAVIIFGFLWCRLEMGYFDYIRKIRKWVQDQL